MREPRAVQITFVIDEDLRLVFQPSKGRAMHDPVAVALKSRAAPSWGLRMHSPGRSGRIGRPGRARQPCDPDHLGRPRAQCAAEQARKV